MYAVQIQGFHNLKNLKYASFPFYFRFLLIESVKTFLMTSQKVQSLENVCGQNSMSL